MAPDANLRTNPLNPFVDRFNNYFTIIAISRIFCIVEAKVQDSTSRILLFLASIVISLAFGR